MDDDEFGGQTQVHLFLFYASCCNLFLSSLAHLPIPPGIPRYSKNLLQVVTGHRCNQLEIRQPGGVRVVNAAAAAAQGAG